MPADRLDMLCRRLYRCLPPLRWACHDTTISTMMRKRKRPSESDTGSGRRAAAEPPGAAATARSGRSHISKTRSMRVAYMSEGL